MPGALARAAARAASALAHRSPAAASPSGRRFAGDLPVKPNPHIEAWNTSREHIEETHRFDGRAFARAALWVVAFPLALYAGMTTEFGRADELAGREKRKVMGSK